MKNAILIYAFSVLLSISAFVSPVFASDYIGDVCLRAGTTENDTRLMNFGLSHMGGGHYQFAGAWDWEDGSGESTPINGNIELIDNNLEFTFTFAFYRPDGIYYRVGHMELDISSLSGDLKMIKTKKDRTTGNTSHGASKMPVSLVQCP